MNHERHDIDKIHRIITDLCLWPIFDSVWIDTNCHVKIKPLVLWDEKSRGTWWWHWRIIQNSLKIPKPCVLFRDGFFSLEVNSGKTGKIERSRFLGDLLEIPDITLIGGTNHDQLKAFPFLKRYSYLNYKLNDPIIYIKTLKNTKLVVSVDENSQKKILALKYL